MTNTKQYQNVFICFTTKIMGNIITDLRYVNICEAYDNYPFAYVFLS